MTLIWSAERMMDLIEEMKLYRCLWDPNDKYRKNKDVRQEFLNKVAVKFDTTPAEIRRKIDSLVQSYRVYRRKVKIHAAKAKHTHDYQPYQPTWFAYSVMHQLLKNVYMPRDELETPLKPDSDDDNDIDIVEVVKEEVPEEIIESSETDSYSKDNFYSNEEYQNSPEQIIKIPKIKDPVPVESHSYQDNCDGSKENSVIIRPSKRSISSRSDAEDTRISEVYDYFIERKKDDEFNEGKRQSQVKDECDIYGELIATKLRKMNELTRQCVMNEMDNLMFRALLNSNYQSQQGPYPSGGGAGINNLLSNIRNS